MKVVTRIDKIKKLTFVVMILRFGKNLNFEDHENRKKRKEQKLLNFAM
jgi:hypothetical protein